MLFHTLDVDIALLFGEKDRKYVYKFINIQNRVASIPYSFKEECDWLVTCLLEYEFCISLEGFFFI